MTQIQDTATLFLDEVVRPLGEGLRALFVTAMPDCLPYDHWVAQGDPLASVDVAQVSAHYGMLLRSNKEAIKELRTHSEGWLLSVEATGEPTVFVKEVGPNFVATFIFEKGLSLGMARLQMKQAIERLKALLPTFDAKPQSRIERVLQTFRQLVPEPHQAMSRLALLSRVLPDELENPASLTEDKQEAIERAACKIVGQPFPMSA